MHLAIDKVLSKARGGSAGGSLVPPYIQKDGISRV